MLGGGELGCPDSSSRPRLGGWFTSWYLFAVDARMPRDGICAGTGYFANADLPLWKRGATVVRSRALGRIAGPPRPTVRILERAIQSGSMLLVVSLRCIMRCSVWLSVDNNSLGYSRRLAVTGAATIGVPRGDLSAGKLRVSLHVDDSPLIRGLSALGRR
jgi:hypothetical protein